MYMSMHVILHAAYVCIEYTRLFGKLYMFVLKPGINGYTSKASSGGESESEKEDALLARYKCLGGAGGPEKKSEI